MSDDNGEDNHDHDIGAEKCDHDHARCGKRFDDDRARYDNEDIHIFFILSFFHKHHQSLVLLLQIPDTNNNWFVKFINPLNVPSYASRVARP